MTTESIRIAVAEVMGIKVYLANGKHGKAMCGGSIVYSAGGFYRITGKLYDYNGTKIPYVEDDIPNYPQSLDACAEFEKTLKENCVSGSNYCVELRRIVASTKHSNCANCAELLSDIFFYGATPLQRCEAFLRLHARWVE